MTTAKVKFLLGYNMKTVINWEWGINLLWEESNGRKF